MLDEANRGSYRLKRSLYEQLSKLQPRSTPYTELTETIHSLQTQLTQAEHRVLALLQNSRKLDRAKSAVDFSRLVETNRNATGDDNRLADYVLAVLAADGTESLNPKVISLTGVLDTRVLPASKSASTDVGLLSGFLEAEVCMTPGAASYLNVQDLGVPGSVDCAEGVQKYVLRTRLFDMVERFLGVPTATRANVVLTETNYMYMMRVFTNEVVDVLSGR